MTDVEQTTRARILIVEDERIVAQDLERRLEELGYPAAQVVGTGEEAVAAAREVRPDLVLMDIRLGGELDGIEAAARIRADDPVPIVYITAYADEETLARAKPTQPFGYVIKPFEARELYTTIEMALFKHQADEAMRRSESNFRTLIERAPMAVAVHRDGRFVYLNSACCAILGYERPDELLGTRVIDIVHPDDRGAVAARLAETAAGAENLPMNEERFLHREGKVITAEVSGYRLEFDGAPAMVVVAQDVTERRQMEVQLALADRMATVGTLAAGVAHEISNPLTYALHNIDRLSEDIPRLTEVLERLERDESGNVSFESIERMRDELLGGMDAVGFLHGLTERARRAADGANRVRAIVRDLKTFSRVDEEAPAPVSVNQAVEAALNMAHNEIKYRARVVDSLGEVPLVIANTGRLSQVFLNLLVNAAHAIDEGRVAENEVEVRSWTEGDEVCVSVRDTGHGIAEENVPRLFEPFFTTKPPGVGSGLGLSICQNIVRAYGGHIEVETALGTGSQFVVRLPAAPKARSTEVAAARIPTPPPVRARMLIVDDEPNIGITLQNLLAIDHEVHLARSGAEAQRFLAADAAIDVILCDLMMAELSGMELHAWLEKTDPDLAARMILMTGGAFTQGARAFLERVPNLRIEKPFKLDRLGRLIARVLGERGRRSASS